MKTSRYRLISQIVFFTAFAILLNRTEYTGSSELSYPAKIFLDIDPLVGLITFITAHTLPLLLWLSILTLFLTVIFGRFFCGWICPMGSINHFTSHLFSRFFKRRNRGSHGKSQRVKYIILFVIIAFSVFGIHLAGFLDPISLLIRSLSVGVLPVVNFLLRGFIYPILSSDSALIEKTLHSVWPHIKDIILSHQQTYYWQSFLIFSIFAFVIFLNYFKNRFFCRVLCPLGALLGIASKFSLVELNQKDTCNSCMGCEETSQGGAKPYDIGNWKKSECLLCFNCTDACLQKSLNFSLTLSKDRTKGETDLSRRAMITSFGAGLLSAPFFKLTPRKKTFNPSLIRPPGSLHEADFLKRCLKCEECMKVCLTNVIQPTFMQAGLEGIWSPYLDMKVGYCEFECTLCGQVCPTGAIKKLDVQTKKDLKIGLAFVDRNRCLPFAFDIPCIVCEEHCPTIPKAIELKDVNAYKNGKKIKLRQPHVNPKKCTGCGICENKCPVKDKAAIRITSVGEERHPQNSLLLEDSLYSK